MTGVIDGGSWRKAEILPYKHAIVPHGATMVVLPSQIAYGSWQKSATPFGHGAAMTAI